MQKLKLVRHTWFNSAFVHWNLQLLNVMSFVIRQP